MFYWDKLVEEHKKKRNERKRLKIEREREYIEKSERIQAERRERLKKITEKQWGGVSKTCPECGNALILKAWESYNSGYQWIGMDHFHGSHSYKIFYVHCKKCKWQKRTFEEWTDLE